MGLLLRIRLQQVLRAYLRQVCRGVFLADEIFRTNLSGGGGKGGAEDAWWGRPFGFEQTDFGRRLLGPPLFETGGAAMKRSGTACGSFFVNGNNMVLG